MSVFNIEHWPNYQSSVHGFAYQSDGRDTLWARMGDDYLVTVTATPSSGSDNSALVTYAMKMAPKILKLSHPMAAAKTSTENYDGILIGCLDFTKSKTAKPKWDDKVFFCTDGGNIMFIFGADPSLKLP